MVVSERPTDVGTLVGLPVLLCALLLNTTPSGAQPLPAFADRTAELGLEPANAAACWADIDNDGWTDPDMALAS